MVGSFGISRYLLLIILCVCVFFCLQLQFDQFKEVEGPADTPLDPDHVDMSVYVRLASVEVIFLNRFVQSMLVSIHIII